MRVVSGRNAENCFFSDHLALGWGLQRKVLNLPSGKGARSCQCIFMRKHIVVLAFYTKLTGGERLSQRALGLWRLSGEIKCYVLVSRERRRLAKTKWGGNFATEKGN